MEDFDRHDGQHLNVALEEVSDVPQQTPAKKKKKKKKKKPVQERKADEDV